jgi:hypothetical protein
MSTTTAGPIDEFVLFAKLQHDTRHVDLLTRVHHLKPDTTDGFFLKVDAEEGFGYEFRVRVRWHFLGASEHNEVYSQTFRIDFPVHSPEGLLRLAEQG